MPIEPDPDADAVHRLARELTATIVDLAGQALARLPADGRAAALARRALRVPLNYMRLAELAAVASLLDLRDGQSVLDVSSPQWFTLALARRHPGVHFRYVNIVPDETLPYGEIACAAGLGNLEVGQDDARSLGRADTSVDWVLSLSVVEHVYPEVGGDVAALREFLRVLRDDGRLALSLPYKERPSIVRVDRAVYEREAAADNFYAREYDADTFARLLGAAGLDTVRCLYVCERPGWGAVDHWEWGPGRGTATGRALLTVKRVVERLGRFSLDNWLSARHLSVKSRPEPRLVNIAALLRRST